MEMDGSEEFFGGWGRMNEYGNGMDLMNGMI